ncbi:MAG: hypothetical protein GMKNLPBB_00826 [Myxococcota bacterium]|nr:hypothetical protein [Myxococcota bacterium]
MSNTHENPSGGREIALAGGGIAAALRVRRGAHGGAWPLLAYQPHARQLEFHRGTERRRAFIAGNRSGKTTAGAVEALWSALGVHPFRECATPNHGWVVTPSHNLGREVIERTIARFLPPGAAEWRASERRWVFRNGSTIGLMSAEAGRELFQGVSREWIWFDEEPPEDIYRECLLRTLDTHGHVWLTLTPLKGFTWVHRDFLAEPRPGSRVFRASTRDNPHVPAEAIEFTMAGLPGHELRSRLHGEFTSGDSQNFFPPEVLERLRATVRPPAWRGELDAKGRFTARADGRLSVWEEPDPPRRYVIGADASWGETGGDFSAVDVSCAETGRTVAEWHGRIYPAALAEQVLVPLGRHFNQALIAVEANGPGQPCLKALKGENHGSGAPGPAYPRLYMERVPGRPGAMRPGLTMTHGARHALLHGLREALGDPDAATPSRETFDELAAFICDAHNRPAGRHGQHDDRVFARAICLHARAEALKWPPLNPRAQKPSAPQDLFWRSALEPSGGGDSWL